MKIRSRDVPAGDEKAPPAETDSQRELLKICEEKLTKAQVGEFLKRAATLYGAGYDDCGVFVVEHAHTDERRLAGTPSIDRLASSGLGPRLG